MKWLVLLLLLLAPAHVSAETVYVLSWGRCTTVFLGASVGPASSESSQAKIKTPLAPTNEPSCETTWIANAGSEQVLTYDTQFFHDLQAAKEQASKVSYTWQQPTIYVLEIRERIEFKLVETERTVIPEPRTVTDRRWVPE